jgi:hypothetical protein
MAWRAILPGPESRPPMPRIRRRPKPDRRRALELLASCRDGCTEAIMLAHGFSIEQTVELVRAGFATAQAERVGRPRADYRGGAVGVRGDDSGKYESNGRSR